jgi:hypothetical protein
MFKVLIVQTLTGAGNMGFKWEQFDDWYMDLRYSIQAAVNGLEVLDGNNKKRKKGAALQLLMLNVSSVKINAGTLANKLTPTSESHDLSLSEAWRIIDLTNDVNSLMTFCRHKNMLLTPCIGQLPVSEEVLIPVFTKMRTELSETQNLIRQSLEEKNSAKGAISISTKKELKKEVYEDFCAAIAMIAHLEAMILKEEEKQDISDANSRFEVMVSDVNNWAETLQADNARLELFLAKSGIRAVEMSRFSERNNTGTVDISLKVFLKAVEADNSNTQLEVFCQSLSYRIFPIEPKGLNLTSKSILQHYAELERRQADTLNKLNQALEDKLVTQKELKEITEELKEEYGSELALLNSLTEVITIAS